MEKLTRDELFSLALYLDLPNLLKFCQTSKTIDRNVCKNDNFWIHKIVNEYPQYQNDFKDKNPREKYFLIYNLLILKKKLNKDNQIITEDIVDLYNRKTLDLSYINLVSIPEQLGNLTNLQTLYLDNNMLTSIPEQLSNLTNLQRLSLPYNKLTSIPEQLGNLTNLQTLILDNNNLTSIPEQLSNLTNLQTLILDNNNLTSIPEEIKRIPGITIYR